MVAVVHTGEELIAETVVTFSVADSEDFWGQDFTGGSDVYNNGLPTEREGGVSGGRDHGDSLEGLYSSGKFSAKLQCGDT